MAHIKKLLIIAGSDSGGGAGLQADIKTATAHKVFASTIVTSLTAQNTQGVFAIHNPDISFLEKQMEVVLEDIKFDAIKIGMLANKKISEIVYKYLYKKKNIINHIILDPVMVATSGDILLEKSAIKFLQDKMLPISSVITPNIDEAEIIAEMKIANLNDMKNAAQKIKKLGAKNVIIKGGHLKNNEKEIQNILLDENNLFYEVTNKKLLNQQFHGTGCTLSSAIACNLSHNLTIQDALKEANKYVYESMIDGFTVGKGSNVLNHFH